MKPLIVSMCVSSWLTVYLCWL